MKSARCMIVLACALVFSGCGGKKVSLYGCWEQMEASEAGLIRLNPAGYSEVTPKSDEVLLVSRDGWFCVFGAGYPMINSKCAISGRKIAVEKDSLNLRYAIRTNVLTVTALDKKKSVYRKLTPEEKTRFLGSLGSAKPSYSTDD